MNEYIMVLILSFVCFAIGWILGRLERNTTSKSPKEVVGTVATSETTTGEQTEAAVTKKKKKKKRKEKEVTSNEEVYEYLEIPNAEDPTPLYLGKIEDEDEEHVHCNCGQLRGRSNFGSTCRVCNTQVLKHW